jgi:hypothetical protein
MRFASVNKSLTAAILVIVALSAVLLLVCPDGIHVPVSGSMGSRCLVMTHSSVLGIGSDSSPLLASVTLAIAVGLAATLALARPTLFAGTGETRHGRSFDPLNGRLRI